MGRPIPPYVSNWVRQDHPQRPTKTLDKLTIPLSSPSKPQLLSALESIHDLLPTSFFRRISSIVGSMGGGRIGTRLVVSPHSLDSITSVIVVVLGLPLSQVIHWCAHHDFPAPAFLMLSGLTVDDSPIVWF
jgi:hypothetical protein